MSLLCRHWESFQLDLSQEGVYFKDVVRIQMLLLLLVWFRMRVFPECIHFKGASSQRSAVVNYMKSFIEAAK